MPSDTARRPADRPCTRLPESSWTISACVPCRSFRRWKRSPRRSNSNPRLPKSLKSKIQHPTPAPIPKKPAPEPAADPRGERLQKVLAAAGFRSRREIESWIAAGRVTVGDAVAKLGDRALPGAKIAVDGKVVNLSTAGQPPGQLVHKTARGR